MPNYTVDLPQFAKPSDTLTLGERYGTSVGRIFSGIGSAIDQNRARQQEEANKAKIDSFLMAYNNPNDATIFSGLKGSMRAEKLSRLLLPLDKDLSAKYMTIADGLRNKETELSQNAEVASAFQGKDLAEKLQNASVAQMKFDSDKGIGFLAKANEFAQKNQEKKDLKDKQEEAIKNVDSMSAIWREDPENKLKQDQLRNAINLATTLGAKVQNPIDDYLREQYNNATLGNRQQALDLQKGAMEFNQIMQEQNSKRDDERLALERAKFAQQQKKDAEELAKSSEGKALDSTSIGQLSNLQTVLTSIKEIKDALSDFRNAKGLKQQYDAIRDLKGSATLGAENLGRVQSGGAISEAELGTFKGLLAPSTLDFIDGGESYLNNVQKLETAINNKISNFAQQGKNLTGGQKKEAQPVKIKGKVFE